ncbi:serine/threonine-protein kinase RIO3-like isoform X2 [Diabrotica undecimpunctata]|uniref:serine/threonine-protein kinase RIO3-like isoform X2 n=1 Tax=Diabrotica undecimpunctata TaxID=50387 RepID=UPI003B63E079
MIQSISAQSNMTSPWAKIEQPDPVNLEEILSEEVARQLQIKKYKKMTQKNNEDLKTAVELPDCLKTVFDNICDSEEALVRMPQTHYDDHKVKLNKSSTLLYNSGEDSINDDANERKFWDRFENLEPELDLKLQCLNKVPHKRHTNDYEVMSEIQRVSRLKIFPRKHSGKTSKTIECCPEKLTYAILYKMIEKQLLKSINGIIGEGRESIILHANSDPSSFLDSNLPQEFAIKVYKTILSDFKECEKFDESDHIFPHRKGGRASERIRSIWAEKEMINLMLTQEAVIPCPKVVTLRNHGRQVSTRNISIWAEKEMTNWMLMQEAGIPCPKVVTLRKHVLVMEFIGKNQIPAPTLKHARNLKGIDWRNAYNQVIEYMKILFNKVNLVHADLTEDNILWYEDKCYFIDASKCVESSHKKAILCLYRDCINITDFFSKKDVARKIPDVATPNELFCFITDFNFHDRVALPEIKESL